MEAVELSDTADSFLLMFYLFLLLIVINKCLTCGLFSFVLFYNNKCMLTCMQTLTKITGNVFVIQAGVSGSCKCLTMRSCSLHCQESFVRGKARSVGHLDISSTGRKEIMMFPITQHIHISHIRKPLKV